MQINRVLLLACSALAFPSRHSETPHRANVISQFSNYLIQAIYGPVPTDPAIHSPSRVDPPISRTRYNEDVILRFNISSEEEARSLSVAANTLFLDVWDANREWADIRVAKDVVGSLLGLLPKSMHDSYLPLIHDLSQVMRESAVKNGEERPSNRRGTRQEFGPSLQKETDRTNIFFDDYQPLSVIVPWMRLMRSMFSDHVTMIDVGQSYEGRSIIGLRVGVRPRNPEKPAEKRKTILVTGGSHAREWVSVSSVTYAAYSFITSYGRDRLLTKLIEDYDWVFIPTINPDGYAKTWEHDRLWRKNTQETSVRFCQGYDIDRSFAFKWDGDSTKGNPCSESFAGEHPFQAVEALRFADWVRSETTLNNVTFVGFFDLHSYSQQILYPYAFSCISTPPTLETLEELGLGLAKAIHQHRGHFYGVTSACEGSVRAGPDQSENRKAWPTIESNGGSALDWMYHEIGTKYAFQIKLADTGSHGFLLPRKYIVPTGEDFFSALSYFGKYLLSNKGAESIGESLISNMVENSHVAAMESHQHEQERVDLKAGIIGLQCALTLLEEGCNEYEVSIVAEYMPGDDPGIYASAWAGGHWRSHESSYTEAGEWDLQTYRYWQDMIRRGEVGCGISAVTERNYWASLKKSTSAGSSAPSSKNTEQTVDNPDPWWSNDVGSYARIDQSELPPNTAFGVSFDTFTISVQQYLAYIQQKVEKLGGNLVRGRLPSNQGLRGAVAAAGALLKMPAEKSFYAIVNASGIQARELVGDENLYPVRGQVVQVKGIAKFCTTRLGLDFNDRAVVIPRPTENLTIIGVTSEPGIESTEVNPDEVPKLLNAAKLYCPELLNENGEFEVLDVGVGIRPARKGGPRIELEQVHDLTVVHAYGVAGGGYQNSVGLARKVLRILQDHSS